jgi:four helix bundle protein
LVAERVAPRGYKDLDVYKIGFDLVKPVYAIARVLPDIERYDLASQVRRAAKSIPANIAEGYALRDAPRMFCKHLRIAYGSAVEMQVHFDLAHELDYVSEDVRNEFCGRYEVLSRKIYRLWQHWRKKLPPGVVDE